MTISKTRITLGSPQDAIAAVPHLLGFCPADSMVVIAAASGRVVATFRYDLPGSYGQDVSHVLRHLVRTLARNKADSVVLVGYGSRDDAGSLLMAAVAKLNGLLTINDALLVTGDRYWSLLCDSCCPADGIKIDSAATVAAAVFTAAGSAPLPVRDDLAAMIAPQGDREAQAMRRALAQLTPIGPAGPDIGHLSRIRELLAMPVPLPDDAAAELIMLLSCIRLRDEAWAVTDSGNPAAQVSFWADVTRRAPGRHAAPPASLLGYAAACMAGNGALARVAVDRALSADPEYSMALLIKAMLDAGVRAPDLRIAITAADLPPVTGSQASQQAST